MWKRIELHNHTNESDGNMTPEELVEYLHQNHIQSFSITDHNTISAWYQVKDLCQKYNMEYIQGFELTSFYGHMLIQNLKEYFPWDDIDEDNGDILFERAHQMGALAGMAHPFSIPSPFSNGMNWTLKIKDKSLIDFIEVINNAHINEPDNRRGIQYWQKLVLDGYTIAPVSGMDLHRKVDMSNYFTTYIEVNDTNLSLDQQLAIAIHSQNTQVTKGPLITHTINNNQLIIDLQNINQYQNLYLEYKTKNQTIIQKYNNQKITFSLEENVNGTLLLYENVIDYNNLIALTGIFL